MHILTAQTGRHTEVLPKISGAPVWLCGLQTTIFIMLACCFVGLGIFGGPSYQAAATTNISAAAQTSATTSLEAQILTGQELLYHGHFDDALTVAATLKSKFPRDTRPAFLQTLIYRWLTRIEPDSAARQQQFEQSVRATIELAQATLKHDRGNVNAVLVLAASYGYRAEYYQFQRERWNKAYDDAVRMQEYLERAKELETSGNIDVQLGLGLYNYYAYVYRKKIGWWKFLVSLPKGDKKKGIAQITTVREHGTHLRVEAWYFLTEIYKRDDDYGDQAIPEAKALHLAYPEQPYFHIFLAGLYHARQDWHNSLQTAQAVLKQADTSPYYSRYITAQATYLVGESSFYLGQYDDALSAFNAIITAQPSNPPYLLPWAYLRRGTIYSLNDRKADAVAEYQHVLKLDDTLNVHELARGFLKNMQK